MSFNPAPPERNRFQEHIVVKADNVEEMNEYIDNLKTKLADECLVVASQVDEQPNTFVISADFVVMPTSQYRDHVAKAFDEGVLGAARGLSVPRPDISSPEELDKQLQQLLAVALTPNLSEKARAMVLDLVATYQSSVGDEVELLSSQAELAIRNRLDAIRHSATHYRQAVVACADAIRLLNITLADMNEDQEEESDAE